MEGPPAADAARASAALPSGLCWRTDPDRRLAALVVRDARAAMHAARLHRRCDEPADASAVCGDGVDVRLFRSEERRVGKEVRSWLSECEWKTQGAT